jgi:hypothetical protein
MTEPLCSRCAFRPRAPKQRWCKVCRAAWMRLYRLKQQARPDTLFGRLRYWCRLFLP